MSSPSHCVTWVETVQITLERRRSYPGTSMGFIGNMLRVRNLDRGDLNHTRDGCRDAAQEYQIPLWTRRYDLERTCAAKTKKASRWPKILSLLRPQPEDHEGLGGASVIALSPAIRSLAPGALPRGQMAMRMQTRSARLRHYNLLPAQELPH